MDHKNQKYSNDFLATQALKKMIPQLLLSLSIFSFVFSYSSLYSSSLVYSPKFQYYNFSANSVPFLSRALNKNCLFLICNGLLVFLAKTSGLVRPPPGSYDLNDILQKRIGDSLQTPLDQRLPTYQLPKDEDDDEEEEEEEEEEEIKKLAEHDERSEQVSILIAESEEEGGDQKDENANDEQGRSWLFDDDDAEQLYGQEVVELFEDEEELEENEELSTQELNQKFEDFIRRMKEEIVINEARQKLVVIK